MCRSAIDCAPTLPAPAAGQAHTLVYHEYTSDVRVALAREKCLKKWNRQWKINLIEKDNPEWRDLYDKL